ncbi:MAG: CoB--CoM heterodisulfide reductase iron-sulfur subunit A family protein [Firmicutes bacterium]|nr:CoB--CoM heterodisulfide reductase iron-sulfur subunit A family protein [Bacillota bacterium]
MTLDKNVGAVLVVGGGIGGMQAALDLANSGFKVYIVEAKPAIGGVMAQLDKTFPTNDCSMCIMSPKLVECGRHLNIEVIPNSEVTGLEGSPGNFTAMVKTRARYIDVEKCTGCGLCAEHCPVSAARDAFNAGLSRRPSVYIDYPQAVPLAYAIDRETCIGCGLCENICMAGAVKYDDAANTRELNVGAVILAPGFEPYDPGRMAEYGYGRYPNVVTSVEFERILSASGPFEGRVLRPSDGDIPRKIAFIQCVGSRDRSCGNEYCSSVCCMYASKEAVIAKEHAPGVEPTIFYMDMRSYGKGFDSYIERAKSEYGVRYIRTRVADISEAPETNNLIVSYEDEGGRVVKEEFDLVVLSVGLEPPKGAVDLARALGIELDEYGFARTGAFDPVETSRPGVFVCGAMQGPKDIPETVTQASGAAGAAAALLASARGSLVREKTYPPEKDLRGKGPRIGVFVCHCGINIGGVVDVPAVVEYAKTLPHVVYAERNLYTCSQDTQKRIQEKIQEHGLTRVVVASCTPRTHEPLFQETIREAGLNHYLFAMANIRDQCSWVHMHEPGLATEKAKDLVRMAVARAALLEPLERLPISVKHSALIIGGGLAGMTAALDLARQGFEVHLVERELELGGHLRRIYFTLEGKDVQAHLEDLIRRVDGEPLIHVYLGCVVSEIAGYVGNFKSRIAPVGGGIEAEVEHGVVIVATGAGEFKPDRYLYGENPRVVTQSEFEELLAAGRIRPGARDEQDEPGAPDGRAASTGTGRTFVMIQCVGSREAGRDYCSRMCCSEAVKNALRLKAEDPEADVYVLYRDIRTYGEREAYFQRAREAGVVFIRYPEDEPPVVEEVAGPSAVGPVAAEPMAGQGGDGGGEPSARLRVVVRDTLLGSRIAIPADMVVLAAAIVPNDSNHQLAQMLKVPLDDNGFFLEAHMKLRPVDFATEGVFLAGLAHAPKSIDETVAQAHAAAARACTVLSLEEIRSEGIKSEINKARCSGCGMCVEVCQYKAIELDSKERVARINAALCKGCGACAATCRCGAVTLKGFTDEEILAEVNAV